MGLNLELYELKKTMQNSSEYRKLRADWLYTYYVESNSNSVTPVAPVLASPWLTPWRGTACCASPRAGCTPSSITILHYASSTPYTVSLSGSDELTVE